MELPFCGLRWIIFIPNSWIFSFLNLPIEGAIFGWLYNVIMMGITWLVWRYVVRIFFILPIAGQILMILQPILTPLFKFWTIFLLIAGPIFIFLC